MIRRINALVIPAISLALAVALACGAATGSAGSDDAPRGDAAPAFNFDAVAPDGNGEFVGTNISNDTRRGYVTVLYFSFVG